MDAPHESHQEARGKGSAGGPNEDHDQISSKFPNLKHYKWWLRVTFYILLLLVGQTTAILLGRLYFDKGGNSKWMATFVESAGFPILIPLLFFFPRNETSPNITPSFLNLTLIYFGLGLLLIGDNLMYSYGLVYLPVSTYSMLSATQLAFNAITSFFLNSQKFTALVLNSLVLLTISACLLAINVDSDDTTSSISSRGKYIVGFICTLGASALFSLYLSLVQLTFEKIFKEQSFNVGLRMQIYPGFVTTSACVVGLFASGEWRSLGKEMKGFEKGSVSYVMTLVWTAIAWGIATAGGLGLILEVSSLFSNVISTLALPLVPVSAVVFFHDKMNGVKVIALILAIWGFLSYIYQHYLDDTREARKAMKTDAAGDGIHSEGAGEGRQERSSLAPKVIRKWVVKAAEPPGSLVLRRSDPPDMVYG